ncbi:MAG: hypothetical protein EP343_11640 [Deltaproteobacteria bacterium]|nr:MAG: hypothetical protein EP343_11640 [Deltaproteobacteria bacterium]
MSPRRLLFGHARMGSLRLLLLPLLVSLWVLSFACSQQVTSPTTEDHSKEATTTTEVPTATEPNGREEQDEKPSPRDSTETETEAPQLQESSDVEPSDIKETADGGSVSDDSQEEGAPEKPPQEDAVEQAPEFAAEANIPETHTPDTALQDQPSASTIKRLVIAGDSWSTGLVQPTRDALNAKGFSSVKLSYQNTANAGSQAAGWAINKYPPAVGGGEDKTKPRMLTALAASLDASPRAEILMLVIGGNDYNRECINGLGKLPKALQSLTYDKIQRDIQTIVDFARKGRPHLKIVLMGYDFLHFEFLVAFGLKINKGHDRKSYNQGLVELDRRKRLIANQTPNVRYAHNFGILQHTYGDKAHPPFPVPNPLTHPPYQPGVAPKPGIYPSYHPFPGGLINYPAPLDVMPDGIHPSHKGFRTIIDYTLSQGLQRWLQGKSW